MGMTATCAACGHAEPSDSHRGARLGACPECGGQMRAHTAGKAKGRYICPVSGRLVTLGLTGVQLDQPMRVALVAEGGRYHGRELGPWERDWLVGGEGKVYGPGCVVNERLDPAGESPFTPRVALVPADPAGDAAAWIVNDKLVYRKCAACPRKVVASDDTCMPEPWTPRRAFYWRRRHSSPTSPGPHPAGTYACRDCDPRRTDPEPF
jgi:hypothetical protein